MGTAGSHWVKQEVRHLQDKNTNTHNQYQPRVQQEKCIRAYDFKEIIFNKFPSHS